MTCMSCEENARTMVECWKNECAKTEYYKYGGVTLYIIDSEVDRK
jgi:hypothetical protein